MIAVFGTARLSANAQITVPKQKTADSSTLDSDKYMVKIPTGWRHFDRPSGNFNALYIMAPHANGYTPSINIIGTPTGKISLDEFFKGNMDDVKAGNIAPDSSGEVEASGLKGKFYTIKIDSKGSSFALKSYFFVKDGFGYVLTAVCLTSQKGVYYPVFEDIVKNFKLK